MRTALSDFHEDPHTRVFLLCLGTAAAGLTLTRANHVFLLEPGLDPAVEQQAVARVHRYGQSRPVKIVRLLLQVCSSSVPLLHACILILVSTLLKGSRRCSPLRGETAKILHA